MISILFDLGKKTIAKPTPQQQTETNSGIFRLKFSSKS